MTNKELQEKLKNFPDDMEILIYEDDDPGSGCYLTCKLDECIKVKAEPAGDLAREHKNGNAILLLP